MEFNNDAAIPAPVAVADSAAAAFGFGAFISYRHAAADRRFAKWLHGELETFRTPGKLVQQGARARVGKVFRDEEELAASANLSGEIDAALTASDFLVVICSPRAPASRWVNEEIKRFRELGRGRRILACLIEGEPAESFPPALLSTLHDGTPEPLAADFRKAADVSTASAHRMARLKLLSTLVGCRFDDLVVREQARRRRLQAIGTSVLLAVLAAITALALIAMHQRDEARTQRTEAERQRDTTLLTQSKFLASLSEQGTEAGNASLAALLALEALPKNWGAAERPYHAPAMTALYRALRANRELLTLGDGGSDATGAATPELHAALLAGDGRKLVVGTAGGEVQRWDIRARKLLASVKVADQPVRHVAAGAGELQILAAVGSQVFEIDLTQGRSKKVISAEREIEWLSSHQSGAAVVLVVAEGDNAGARLWTRDASGGYTAHNAVGLSRGPLYHYTPSPDGRHIAFGDAHTPHLVIADLQDGSTKRLQAPEITADGNTMLAAFAPAGDRLLVSSGKHTLLFDLNRPGAPTALVGHYDTVLRAAISPDSDLVATGSEDGRVLLWSRSNGYRRPVKSFDGFVRGANLALMQGAEIERVLQQNQRLHDDFEGAVGHLAFSADGKRLLASSGDRSVSVFGMAGDRKRLVHLSGHTGRIDLAALSADGATLVTLDRERTGRIWRATADPTMLLFGGDGTAIDAVLPAGISPPVALVKHPETGCGGLWRAWRFQTNEPLGVQTKPEGVPTSPSGIGTLSLDGSTLLSGFPEGGALGRIDVATGQVTKFALPAGQPRVNCAYANPRAGEMLLVNEEGRGSIVPLPPLAASVNAPPAVSAAFAHAAQVSPGSLSWLLSLQGKPAPEAVEKSFDSERVSFSRGGARLLIWRRDGSVALLDANGGREIRRFTRPPERPAGAAPDADGRDFAFSDDGALITGITATGLRLWKADDGSLVRQLVTGAPSAAWMGGVQQRRLISAEKDGRVLIHDAEGRGPPAVLGETFQGSVAVAVSPDGRRLLVEGEGDVCPSLWDIPGRRKLAVFAMPAGCAFRFKFSPDGRALVSAVSQPQGLAVWEAEGGALLVRHGGCLPAGVEMFDGDPSDVMTNGFSDDGRYVYAGTLGGALCVWVHPGAGDALIANARAQLSRGFSKAEQRNFPVEAAASAAAAATSQAANAGRR